MDMQEDTTSAVLTANKKLLLRCDEAAELCGCSARRWRTWDAGGKIPMPVYIGRSKFWRPQELRDWINAGCPDRRKWKMLQNTQKPLKKQRKTA